MSNLPRIPIGSAPPKYARARAQSEPSSGADDPPSHGPRAEYPAHRSAAIGPGSSRVLTQGSIMDSVIAPGAARTTAATPARCRHRGAAGRWGAARDGVQRVGNRSARFRHVRNHHPSGSVDGLPLAREVCRSRKKAPIREQMPVGSGEHLAPRVAFSRVLRRSRRLRGHALLARESIS